MMLSLKVDKISAVPCDVDYHGKKTIPVPTLDIDLVWHTHQSSTYFYFLWCLDKSKDKNVIDHDENVKDTVLDGLLIPIRFMVKIMAGLILFVSAGIVFVLDSISNQN